MSTSDLDRFWPKMEVTDSGCWQWTGYIRPNGYGQFRIGPKMELAHRAAWMLLRGPIPDGLTIDHLCRNRSCVNPAHLEPVTNRVNVLRGIGPAAQNAKKTHCYLGHPISGDNLWVDNRGLRICLACKRRKMHDYYVRNADRLKAYQRLHRSRSVA